MKKSDKGLSIKDGRSQGVCLVRTFFGLGEGGL